MRRLTKDRNKVMISYGRTPPLPTIPDLTTFPEIHVDASKSKTPMTGALSRPIATLRGAPDQCFFTLLVKTLGKGMRSGKITKASDHQLVPK